jgi:micrococcal nuclease
MSRRQPLRSRGASVRRWLLIGVLAIAASGLLYRMLRPYFDAPPPSVRDSEPVTRAEQAVELSRVIDGDTIEVRWRGERERVRLLRIDTPERGRSGYRAAGRALEAILGDHPLKLEFENPERAERDKYGRLLAYVIVDGENANVEMVRQGWTRFWTRYGSGRLKAAFREAEKQAREEQAGLWGTDGWNVD